jgi:hypothetical protein
MQRLGRIDTGLEQPEKTDNISVTIGLLDDGS